MGQLKAKGTDWKMLYVVLYYGYFTERERERLIHSSGQKRGWAGSVYTDSFSSQDVEEKWTDTAVSPFITGVAEPLLWGTCTHTHVLLFQSSLQILAHLSIPVF